MPRLLHQLLVTLILMVGIVAHQIISGKSKSFHHSNVSPLMADLHTRKPVAITYTPISNVSVPEADFPETFNRFKTLYSASLRLQALFDSDGRVKEVTPFPMLPYGVPESAAGKGEYLNYTPFMAHWKFVKQLPVGFTEIAIDQIKHSTFSPARLNGKPIGQWVRINVEFSYNENRYAAGCSSVEVTIMDDRDIRWTGNTWVHRDRGCVIN
jgi:hypothetical protein